MAGLEVNPQVAPTNPPEFSREVRTPSLYLLERGNKSQAAGADAAKEAITGIAKVADEGFKSAADSTLRAGVDKVNSRFGVPQAAALADSGQSPTGVRSEADADGESDMFDKTKGSAVKGAPAGVQRLGGQLESLQGAYQAGKLSDSYYYGQLDAVVSRTKAMFPGHVDYVDQKIKDIVGVNPANALRRSILNDMDIAEKAKNASNNRQYTFFKDNMGKLQDMANDGVFGPGVKDITKIPFETAFRAVAEYDGNQANITRQESEIKLDDLKTAHGVRAAGSILDQELGALAVRKTGGLIAKSGLDSDAIITEARKETAGGNPLDTKTLAQVNQAMSIHSQDLTNSWNKVVNAPHEAWGNQTYAQILPPEELAKRRDAFMKNGMAIWDPITDKDFGAIHQTKIQIEASNNATVRQLQIDNPGLSVAKALRDALGPEFDLGAISTKDQFGKMSPIMESLTTIHIQRMVDPNTPASGRASTSPGQVIADATAANHGIPPDKQFVLSNASAWGDIIVNPKYDEKGRLSAAHHIYGADNAGTPFLNHFNTRDKLQVMPLLASPEITEQMWDLGRKNPQAWSEYSTWVKRNFGGLYAEQENTIVEAQKFTDSPYEVSFDSETGLFQDRVRPGVKDAYRFLNRQTDPLPVAVHQLNTGLSLLGPVLVKEGTTVQAELSKLIPQGNAEGMQSSVSNRPVSRESHGASVMQAVSQLFTSWMANKTEYGSTPEQYNENWNQSEQKETPGQNPGAK